MCDPCSKFFSNTQGAFTFPGRADHSISVLLRPLQLGYCLWQGLLPAQKANIRMLQISVNGLEEGEFPPLFQIQTSRFSLKLIYPVNLEGDQVIFCSKVQRMSLKQYRMRAGLGEELTLCPWSSNRFATYISYKVLLLGNLTASSRKYCLSLPKKQEK